MADEKCVELLEPELFESRPPYSSRSRAKNHGHGEDHEFVAARGTLPEFNLESQVKRLQHAMNDWREIILPVKSVLLWEKQWHPGAILGSCTVLFTILWLLDPNLLTVISVLGLTVTLSDYFVPIIASTVFRSEMWTLRKEKEYESVCRTLIMYKEKIAIALESYYLMRTTKPKLYYTATILTLAFLAWVGNTFNNLFLTYLTVTSVLMMPGMETTGLLRKYFDFLAKKLGNASAKKKPE